MISLFYFLSHSYTECIKWIKYLLYFIINIKKMFVYIFSYYNMNTVVTHVQVRSSFGPYSLSPLDFGF